jgi:hypothetical protein
MIECKECPNDNLPKLEKWKEPRMKGTGKCYKPNSSHYWYEHALWEAAKLENLPIIDVPVCAVPINYIPWELEDLEDMMYHIRKVEQADLMFPVIFDDKGNLIDGYHRLVKAIMNGYKTIKAVRFITLPEISGTDGNT